MVQGKNPSFFLRWPPRFHSEMANLSLRRGYSWKRGKRCAILCSGACVLSLVVLFPDLLGTILDQRHSLVSAVWEALICILSQALLLSILKWDRSICPWDSPELKHLSPSGAPLLSHIRNPSCWDEASRRTVFSKICAMWPGTHRRGPSIHQEWDFEPVATSISTLQKPLESEKWAAAVSPRSLLFSRVCLF